MKYTGQEAAGGRTDGQLPHQHTAGLTATSVCVCTASIDQHHLGAQRFDHRDASKTVPNLRLIS